MMKRSAAGPALVLALVPAVLVPAFLAGSAQAAVGLPATGGPALARTAAGTPDVTRVEYYCSPGFEPSYGGSCVARPPRAEIELFVDQPLYATETTRVVRHARRYRHGLRARY